MLTHLLPYALLVCGVIGLVRVYRRCHDPQFPGHTSDLVTELVAAWASLVLIAFNLVLIALMVSAGRFP